MSLSDLQARLLWDASSKGGSQADISRRYNEALQYLLGDQLHKMAVQSNGGLMGMNPVRGAAQAMGVNHATPTGGYASHGATGSHGAASSMPAAPAASARHGNSDPLWLQTFNGLRGGLNPLRGWEAGRAIVDLFS